MAEALESGAPRSAIARLMEQFRLNAVAYAKKAATLPMRSRRALEARAVEAHYCADQLDAALRAGAEALAGKDIDDESQSSGTALDRGRALVSGPQTFDRQGRIPPYRRQAPPTWLCGECRHQWLAAASSAITAPPSAPRAEALAPSPADEEMVPHAFNLRTHPQVGEEIREGIWCKDCAYHRDHAIHDAEALAPQQQCPERTPGSQIHDPARCALPVGHVGDHRVAGPASAWLTSVRIIAKQIRQAARLGTLDAGVAAEWADALEAESLRAEALAPPAPPMKAWLLTEKRKDGRIVNEAIALTNDVAREWVQSPDMEFGQARSALPLKILPAPPRAEALAKLTNTI